MHGLVARDHPLCRTSVYPALMMPGIGGISTCIIVHMWFHDILCSLNTCTCTCTCTWKCHRFILETCCTVHEHVEHLHLQYMRVGGGQVSTRLRPTPENCHALHVHCTLWYVHMYTCTHVQCRPLAGVFCTCHYVEVDSDISDRSGDIWGPKGMFSGIGWHHHYPYTLRFLSSNEEHTSASVGVVTVRSASVGVVIVRSASVSVVIVRSGCGCSNSEECWCGCGCGDSEEYSGSEVCWRRWSMYNVYTFSKHVEVCLCFGYQYPDWAHEAYY